MNYGCYFGVAEEKLISAVDFLFTQRMADGGFNCMSNRSGAVHSSLHTTLSVAEGILQYRHPAIPIVSMNWKRPNGIAANSCCTITSLNPIKPEG